MKGVPVRLAELLAALSLATDLGMGLPSGHAVQTCLLSVRLARDLGLPDDQVSDVFYVAPLRYLGCTADASEVARRFGSWQLPTHTSPSGSNVLIGRHTVQRLLSNDSRPRSRPAWMQGLAVLW